ncbi:hypothetical protein Dimus_037328, partial [Dionaea muscipula]
ICSCPSLLWFSLARLAPPSYMRRREEVVDGWTDWLTAYPDAHKRASDRVRARRLVKLVTKVTRVDDDFRGMIGCRRSGRLSAPACPASAVLGSGRSTDLKPIEEALASVGGEDIDGDEGVDLLLAPVSGVSAPPSDDTSDDSGETLSCLHSRRCARDDARLDLRFELTSITEETILATVESGEARNSSCCDVSVTRPVISGRSLPPIQVVFDSHSLLPLPNSDEFLRGGSSIEEDELGMEEMGKAVEISAQGFPEAGQAREFAVDSGVSGVQLLVTDGGQVHEVQQAVPQLASSRQKMVSEGFGKYLGSVKAVDVLGDLANPLAQAASKGSGDRGGAGISYASAVGSDRRSNVRLHYVPSVKLDDDEELCMTDSHRDEMEWAPCLVGHFLQSGVPFSTVRPRLLHLWRAEGLME